MTPGIAELDPCPLILSLSQEPAACLALSFNFCCFVAAPKYPPLCLYPCCTNNMYPFLFLWIPLAQKCTKYWKHGIWIWEWLIATVWLKWVVPRSKRKNHMQMSFNIRLPPCWCSRRTGLTCGAEKQPTPRYRHQVCPASPSFLSR